MRRDPRLPSPLDAPARIVDPRRVRASSKLLVLASCAVLAACGEREGALGQGGQTSGGHGGGGGEHPVELTVTRVSPSVIDPAGGSRLVIEGKGLDATSKVLVAGKEALVEVVSASQLCVESPALDPSLWGGTATIEVRSAGGAISSPPPVTVWAPSEIGEARVFDAAHGLTAGAPRVHYEWQRLTPSIGPDWRVRDGNTLTFLPSTGRYWMVGGWNGYQAPEGFSTIDPGAYPPENTTSEVWSSADGVAWRLELPHGNTQFERRHSHNTVLWRDRLWMIGGDHHQGKYNHDVVSSADGVHWRVELGPGTTPPPWSERGLQVSGVYAGKLWTVGGQDLIGDPDTAARHNDVWSTDDGIHWTEVAADAPASATRWAGCGVLDGLIEFHGEMWLVGCAVDREDAVGHTMSNEVWSTKDGVTWKLHAKPPWVGKIWPNVVVWQDKIWMLFGYTYGDSAAGWPAGNAKEVWYSSDGETWASLPHDIPVPGSHAQGVAVTEDALLLAGGNYSFGFGDGVDKSVWRLGAVPGDIVSSWEDRAGLGLHLLPASAETAPLRVRDAFGRGRAGAHFDGSTSLLALAEGMIDEASEGFSVFFAARAPYSPPPYGWVETYNPASTVVGGAALGWQPQSSIGFTDGALSYVSRRALPNGDPTWDILHTGAGLQGDGAPKVHVVGLTHGKDGKMRTFIDGEPGNTGAADFDAPRAWSRIGGGIDGGTEGPYNRFAGTIGAVVIVPRVVSDADAARIHQWALGRFGDP